MSAKNTWLWIAVAAALFAFIFFYQHHAKKPAQASLVILPSVKAAAVTSIQVRPGPNQLEIRAERTNQTWQLTKPAAYPAEGQKVEDLLRALEELTPATYITEAELKKNPKADQEYGLAPPRASITLNQQDGLSAILLVGAPTTPGDQIYLKVPGMQGVYIVDAALLKLIPHSNSDWRDTTVISFDNRTFDRVAVTNNGKAFVLELDHANGLWRMVWPRPPARADSAKLWNCLTNLQSLRIRQFVSDTSKPDLELYGLGKPELELAIGDGTKTLELLQFGKSPTNDASQVYARRAPQSSIFTLPKDPLAPWRAQLNEFRDPHLLVLSGPVENVQVRGEDRFTLQHQGSNQWTILPAIPADTDLVNDFLATLTELKVVEFVNDNVTELGWATYGLTIPIREYVLRCADAGSGLNTNSVMVELKFGLATNQPDRVFVRRTDESSVYAIATNDFAQLPSASWQLRERRIWHVSENDVAGLSSRQQGKTRRLIRIAAHQWSLAPGSQGVINDLAVEETVRGLIQVSAHAWRACGEQQRALYGLVGDPFQIAVEMKDGTQLKVEFGGEAPNHAQYAGVTLDGQLWIFEFPWLLYRDVVSYLSPQ